MNQSAFLGANNHARFSALLYKRCEPMLRRNDPPKAFSQATQEYIDAEQIQQFDNKDLDMLVYEWDDKFELAVVPNNERLTEQNMELKRNAIKETYPYTEISRETLLQPNTDIAAQLKEAFESVILMFKKYPMTG
jgi:hypothetical protein